MSNPPAPFFPTTSTSSQELVRDALHAIVTGRKSWKTVKGKSEAVWPPYLEAALIEGLERYRSTEGLGGPAFGGGRFPMRNRFISEHIYRTTGKLRTPKQIGSRLQQWRDTSGGKRVLKLLSDRPEPTSTNATTPTTEGVFKLFPSSTPPTPIAPTRVPAPPPPTIVDIPLLHPSVASSPTSPTSPTFPTFHDPRPISTIDPTVTFISRPLHPTSPELERLVSGFSVYVENEEGRKVCVFREEGGMECLGEVEEGVGEEGGKRLYRVGLVPGYWGRVCESEDPTRYIIIQNIYRLEPPPTTTAGSPTDADVEMEMETEEHELHPTSAPGMLLSTVEYRFTYPLPTPATTSGWVGAEEEMGLRMRCSGGEEGEVGWEGSRPSTSCSTGSYGSFLSESAPASASTSTSTLASADGDFSYDLNFMPPPPTIPEYELSSQFGSISVSSASGGRRTSSMPVTPIDAVFPVGARQASVANCQWDEFRPAFEPTGAYAAGAIGLGVGVGVGDRDGMDNVDWEAAYRHAALGSLPPPSSPCSDEDSEGGMKSPGDRYAASPYYLAVPSRF